MMTYYEFLGKVDYRGQITIPENIRQRLKAVKGTELRVRVCPPEETFEWVIENAPGVESANL